MYNENYPPVYNEQAYNESYTPAAMSSVMRRVYMRMTGGLLLTAFIALFCATSTGYISFLAANLWFRWVLIIAEFGIVIGVSGGINKLSSTTSALLFYLFAAVNGAMLCSIFWAYSLGAIAKTFFITAGTFGLMSVYGYFTDKDLTKFGSLFIMGIFGLIIASLVNIFLKSSGLDWAISIFGVLIFVGLTAWDTQQIKRMSATIPASQSGRLATIGALSLYLDFINLFLYLLRIFGGNRD